MVDLSVYKSIMKAIVLGLSVLVFSSFSIYHFQQEAFFSDSHQEKLDEYFEALTNIEKFNGAVLIKQNGQIVFNNAYNIHEDLKHDMNVNTEMQFDIHSISKLMAKACVVNLERGELISRNDKIQKYLPDFPRGDEITIQHLMDNASGLPRELSLEIEDLINVEPKDFVQLIKAEKLLFEPGSDQLYSNLGYQVLYYIISTITEKPFVQYVNEAFFVPLQMNNSGAHFHFLEDKLSNLAANFIINDDEYQQVPNFTSEGKNQAKIFSTNSDLMKFITFVKSEPYASVMPDKNGNIGWSGGGEGIRTHAKASIKGNYEFVMFSNFDEIPFSQILADVESIMTNQPYDIPKEINRQSVTVDRNIMEQYVGKYDMAEFNHHEFEIRIEKDSFAFYQNGEFNTFLHAENDSTFFYDPKSAECFEFRKDGPDKHKLIFFWKGIPIQGLRK